MTPEIRAHRILCGLKNYQKIESLEKCPPELLDTQLGKPIGFYQSPGFNAERIIFFADGLAWQENSQAICVRYNDMIDVTPSSSKESEYLLLRMKGGKVFKIPVSGRNEAFFDSMEVLRFLDRVIRDAKKN
jgi:hypothetical protein